MASKLCCKHSCKSFWNYIKTKVKCKRNADISILLPDMDNDDIMVNNPKDVAKLFNKYFASVFSSYNSDVNDLYSTNYDIINPSTLHQNDPYPIKFCEIVDAISRLKFSNSCGLDNVSNTFLKKMARAQYGINYVYSILSYFLAIFQHYGNYLSSFLYLRKVMPTHCKIIVQLVLCYVLAKFLKLF